MAKGRRSSITSEERNRWLDDLEKGSGKGITQIAVTAERAFLEGLGGGCQAPIGAYARVTAEEVSIQGIVGDPESGKLIKGTQKGNTDNPAEAGKKLAQDLLSQGADAFLGSYQT